jgi:hypothetical protein
LLLLLLPPLLAAAAAAAAAAACFREGQSVANSSVSGSAEPAKCGFSSLEQGEFRIRPPTKVGLSLQPFFRIVL